MSETIEIIPYSDHWPEEYNHIATALKTALGDYALAVDHIGSTSIPGLAAKDVIDVQVTVASLEVPVQAALKQLGYIRKLHLADHRPPGREDLADTELEKHFYFKTNRRVNLHIRVNGRFNQRYALLCRDYLRAHPRAASAYAVIKQQLAKYFPDNADAYYDIKDPVFDVMMEGAEEWIKLLAFSR
ncbi:GrpB family protein [Chitinophaga sp. 22321]|uniref:GrpB family protein n=1 Tax=Chitinophaga hostae TaxID=2831022 RepID=A0ABS5J552_9BACT|nr:GrpB family protein [Chitinophaga hostae]MBS0030331.1 GrpB family protein [Chitinophaga hostae]